MTYAKNINHSDQVSLIKKIQRKIGKFIAKYFPLNSIRVIGLKLAGFHIGKKVYIGGDLLIASLISENTCDLIIKDRVAIGPRVTLILSSDANWSNLMDKIDPVKGRIILEEDCWIGAGAIILPNVTVGASSIIGAGSIVTKSVPPNTVVAGNPARVLKTL